MNSTKMCPVCRSMNTKYLYQIRTGTVWSNANTEKKDKVNVDKTYQCLKCKLVFKDLDSLRINFDEYYANLNEDYFGMLHEDRRIKEHREMTKLINEDKMSGKLIDIGCGTGGFLDSLDKNKWEKWGVEPAGFAREILIKKNIRALNDTFLNVDLPENYFDVVTMFDVIEHIVNPLAHLRKVWKILKDDGVLLIATPNVDSLTARVSGRYWRHFQPIAHLIFFSPQTLSQLLRKEGFSDFYIKKYDYSLSFSKAVVNMVKSTRKFVAKAVLINMAKMIHAAGGIDLLKILPSFNTVIYLPWFYDFFCIKAKKNNK